MTPFHSKYNSQLLSWYQEPTTGYCHLVPMALVRDADGTETLMAAPTATQAGLIVYPEDNPDNAGHFFCCNGGRIINLN